MAYNKTWEEFRNEYVSEYGSWAADALPVNIKAPNAARIANGWTIEQPPHNFFNWHMNRTDNRLIDAEARLVWMALAYTARMDTTDENLRESIDDVLARIAEVKEVTDKVSDSAGAGLIPTTGNDGKINKEWLPYNVIAGSIMMFHGSFGGSDGKRPIPKGATEADEGWALCDGTNGTPDLQGRFIVGTGGGYGLGATGGAATIAARDIGLAVGGSVHGHAISWGQMPSHNHSTSLFRDEWYTGHRQNMYGNGDTNAGSLLYTSNSGNYEAHAHGFNGWGSATVPAHENRPPFYALAYIMKL